mmetsp:Transcript_47956/g.100262  ORF Transcript_47956/g.100262 Transcript_47956/m.100262 type:complete len:89 (+) Transcript_47956:38-304(+)
MTIAAYITMGWTSILIVEPLRRAIPAEALSLLFWGGVLYTVGAVVYAVKHPNPLPRIVDFHGLWHVFVLAAAGCHYASILLAVQAAAP